MNRQRFYFFLLLLLSSAGHLPCAAQHFFNKRYTVGCAGNVFTGVLERNKRYYVFGIGNDSSNHIGGGRFSDRAGIKFTVLDSTGTLISSSLYQRPDKRFTGVLPSDIPASNNCYALEDGSFIHAITVMDTARAPYAPAYFNFQAAITQFDSTGNVLRYKEYERPVCTPSDITNQMMADFKPDRYGNWLMLTSLVCSGKISFCLRKFDKDLNEIWTRNFNTKGLNNMASQLMIDSDGYIMTGFMNNGNTGIPHISFVSSLIIKCDTAGDTLWSWQNTFDKTQLQYTINDILRSKDGGYIYCGSGAGEPSYFAGSKEWAGIAVWGYVEKLDAGRKSVWKKQLGYTIADVKQNEQTIIKELPDGNIVVAGTLARYYNDIGPRGNTKAALTKLNGLDGSVIWRRVYDYHPDTLSGFIYDMRQTADGGFILAGECKDDVSLPFDGPIQRGWLIKVDSNGCEGPGDPQCKPVSITENKQQASAIHVYPNPATTGFELVCSAARNEALTLSVCDVTGRSILQAAIPLQQYHIDATQWANGIYYYQVRQQGILIHAGKLIKQ